MQIILVTGQSGVGKTDITKACSKRLHAMYLRSRDIARHIAHLQGYTRARDWILAVSPQQAIQEIDEYIVAAIDNAKTASIAIVDGAYDHNLLEQLEKRFDRNDIHIVEITASHDIRLQRTAADISGDDTAAEQEMTFLDDLKDQVGFNGVINKAEIVVENGEDNASAVDVICALVSPSPTPTV